jgi:hypothetical protein
MNGFFKRFSRFIADRPVLVLGMVLAASAVSASIRT